MENQVRCEPRAAPRVLVAEDNMLIGLDLEKILQDSGCEVVGPFPTAKAAIDKMGSEHVDVAVIDFFLADGTAEPVARLLDQRGIPYALCSGAGRKAFSNGFPHTPILAKPYNADDVSSVVNSLMASLLNKV